MTGPNSSGSFAPIPPSQEQLLDIGAATFELIRQCNDRKGITTYDIWDPFGINQSLGAEFGARPMTVETQQLLEDLGFGAVAEVDMEPDYVEELPVWYCEIEGHDALRTSDGFGYRETFAIYRNPIGDTIDAAMLNIEVARQKDGQREIDTYKLVVDGEDENLRDIQVATYPDRLKFHLQYMTGYSLSEILAATIPSELFASLGVEPVKYAACTETHASRLLEVLQRGRPWQWFQIIIIEE